ncbi:MAG: agmatine deiminase family protein [Planctomycetota bacterium]|jgi:agmatine/peptidylarginine deiminase
MSRRSLARRGLLVVAGLLVLVPASFSQDQGRHPKLSPDGEFNWSEEVDGPLPRWPDTGRVPDDPDQPLVPYAIDLSGASAADLGAPTSGLIASPPEYAPTDGVIFRYSSGAWASVVVDCVAGLTGDPTHDEKAYVVVSNGSQQSTATSQFTSAGADMSKVVFIIEPSDSIWLRDYGPHFITQDGAQAIVDSHYYPSRPKDNFIPTLLAEDLFVVPAYPMGLYYSGGNFQPGPARQGFTTSLVFLDNPEMSTGDVEALYNAYQGIDTLHVMPKLPGSVDGTGHIDMWIYIVDEDDVIISEFKPGSNATAIQITNNAVPYFQSLGFTVHRTPAWNVGWTHYTYTNAFRVNDRIFTIKYGDGNSDYLDEDADAAAAWAAAAGPGVELIPIDCYSIIPAAGAIHCIVMQVPRHADPLPAAAVVTLDGGELTCTGHFEDLLWTASDDVGIDRVEIAYSTDGGTSFPNVIAADEPDDGHYSWLVPDELSAGTVLRVSAYDTDENVVHATSATALEIAQAPMSVYDFSVDAGVDRWGWGGEVGSLLSLDGQRYPSEVSTPIQLIKHGAYPSLAASDATGGDGDTNRYISPVPGSSKASAHIFEFTVDEPTASILDISVLWEGYGDQCLQMEVYVWDDVAGNWGDGAGSVGINRYLANWAGNRDEALVGHIRSDFARYVDGAGKITLLVVAERDGQETFHDYLAVSVAYGDPTWGTWANLGQGLAGTRGVPSLVGSGGLVGGEPLQVQLVSALENAAATLVMGFDALDAPFKGGVLVPNPALWVFGLLTDGGGALSLSGTWPNGVPSGLSLYLQVWVVDPQAPVGLAGSNGVVGTTL